MATFDGAGMDTPREDLAALKGLLRLAAKSRPPKAALEVVEVGSWAGRTALALAGPRTTVFCVDHWRGSPGDRSGALAAGLGPDGVFRAFCKNVGPLLFKTIFPLKGESASWAAVWNRPVDLVFIDGDHREWAVRDDLRAWARHVRPGGVVALHDYGFMPGVTKVADEWGIDGVLGATVAYRVIRGALAKGRAG